MADDHFNPVVEAETALRAVRGIVEARQGYKTLIVRTLSPYPLEFQHDQTKRNQMITLLSRADTLWVLALVYAESAFVSRKSARLARDHRSKTLGTYLTRATLARGLAISESGAGDAIATRRHQVAAARLVEAGLAYGLFELDEKPDDKQQPIKGTIGLAKFIHALGDHAYWTMREALGDLNDPAVLDQHGVKEAAPRYRTPDAERLSRVQRFTADDVVMGWLSGE